MGTEQYERASPGRPTPGNPTARNRAMAFYQTALQAGPRPASEVLEEGVAAGHTRRTLERARAALNVHSWPDGYQGPRLIALPTDPAVKAVKERRAARQQRQRNGRRKKHLDEGGSLHKDEPMAAAH